MLEVAKKAAQEAGKILLDGFNQVNEYSYKEDWSQSTQADKDAEKIIIDTIKANFPDHAILAEESGESGESDYKWIIDPLDGTSNFVRRIPLFGVSIALAFKDKVVLGVICLPTRGELYWAEAGKGSFLNGKKLQVSTISNPKQAITFFESGRDEESRQKLIAIIDKTLTKIGTFKKLGTSAYSLPLIAAGEAEVMVEVTSHIWDVAAGLLLVEEAGGKVTTLSGKDWTIKDGDLLISNSASHANFLELIG